MTSIEVNGSFYSLQRPSSYAAWRAAVPSDVVHAVKGGRFITHLKALRDVETPLANFFASGVLALGPQLGPVLWQLPERFVFDRERVAGFFALLPRSTAEAARLAEKHDDKLKEGRILTTCEAWMEQGHDVHVYFDNDAKGHAPHDAVRLVRRLGLHTTA